MIICYNTTYSRSSYTILYEEATILEYTLFGSTGMKVSRTGFGALPIQRISDQEAVEILHAAYDAGITFYDTALGYPTSEHKLGLAFADRRDKIVITTKSPAKDGKTLLADLDHSLADLKTDHVDVYQFHLAPKCHRPGEADGLYEAMTKAKEQGKVRHIGITTHKRDVAVEAANSGLYESIQFPFSYLSDEGDHDLVRLCEQKKIGYIAMKALSGGLITNARAAFAYMRQFKGVIPIWGVQRMSEMKEFIALESELPPLDDDLKAVIEKDRSELSGNFCRSCGYCMPCPVGIELFQICRMPQTIRRMRTEGYLTDEWRAKMELTKKCIHCGACAKKCPYELNPQELIKIAYDDYTKYAEEWRRTH